MDYMTVKEASEKWKLSERMIRKYCEQGRIEEVIHVGGFWIIPEDASQPNENKPEVIELTPLAKKIVYQRNKNNHFGIYEYIQVNLAYSSNRMASNRLTRQQVEEVYRTNKVATAFEPMKVDDLIEVLNHFICVQYVVDNIAAPLTPSFIKNFTAYLHTALMQTGNTRRDVVSSVRSPVRSGCCPKKSIEH